MKIPVTLGHVFLKKLGHEEVNVAWKFLLCESFFTLMGKLEMWMAHGGKQLRKTVVSLEHRPEETAKDRAEGPDAMSSGRTITGEPGGARVW